MKSLNHEVRLAFRMLAKQPGFTLIAVLMLALGIGANTAIFSVVNAVLLRPLPFPQPENLVAIWEHDIRSGPENNGEWSAVSYPDFQDWQKQNRVFERIAVCANSSLTLTDGREATHIQGEAVSSDLFPLLGVQPVLGRSFLAREDEPGNHVVILSHALYERRFGSDPSIIGRSIVLDGQLFQIIGVMPAGFQFPVQEPPAEAWTTVSTLRESHRGGRAMTEQRGNDFMSCVARLKNGVSLAQAQANLETVAAALRKQYPDSNSYVGVRVLPLLSAIAGTARSGLIMLCGMAGCVLLAACVNVANLLLARSLARRKEISIRAALGAGRYHIVQQLLAESGLLALLGGLAGLLIAVWGVDLLKTFLPANVPRISEIAPDWRVLVFTIGASILVGVGAGILPAWRASDPNLVGSLNESSRGSSESAAGKRTRASLVIIEIVLALVLLASAGLLIQTFLRLHQTTPGFDPNNVLTARIALSQINYPEPEQATAFYRKLLGRLSELPGVQGASATWWLPLSGNEVTFDMAIEERPMPKSKQPVVQVNCVGLNYFNTLRIPFRNGRDFTVGDDLNAPPVAIVSESFARQFFPAQNPIGKRIKPNGSAVPGEPPFRQIIAIVSDTRALELKEAPKPQIYLPDAQFPTQSMSVLLRAAGNPRALVSSVRQAVTEIDKDVPVFRPSTLADYRDASVAQPRFQALLLSLFSAVALLLAAGGIFGVMTYAVTQRTQEMGIRLALGAQRSDVLLLVIKEGMLLVLVGLGLGLIAVLVSAQLMRSLLYGVGPTHFPTLFAVSALLGIVALVACWWPAQRASSVDPLVALRSE